MTSYDENLEDNPYHQILLKEHLELLKTISLKGWILCIPRHDSITTPVTPTDLYNHIVQTTGFNLTGQKVTLSNSKIQHNGNTINILFKETFHLKHMKYSAYCIEHPINTQPTSSKIYTTINNLHDATNFLPKNTCAIIEETCDTFLLEHLDLPCYTLKQIQEAYQILYNRTLMSVLKLNQQNPPASKKTVSILDSLNLTVDQFDRNALNNLKLSVAVYMQHSLKNAIFQAVSNACAHHDAVFNKTTRNLQHITCYNDVIPAARCELNRLNHTMIVSEKITCLRNCFRVFSSNKKALNSDDLLQLLTVLIVKSHFSNWIANLVYLQLFNCSDGKGEDAFLVTSLEAAVEFIKSGEVGEVVEQHSQGLFAAVARCDLDFVKKEFEKERVEPVQLCHPLCDCDSCVRVIDGGGFNVRDDKGRTLLHHSCIHGYPHMVDFLLQSRVEINAVDYFGCCAVHHAAAKGNQNALLLLLHSGASLNVADCDGNTPLHLAVNNGHDSCVKAILYFSEQKGYGLGVNMTNNLGDSALHLAAKWGYINILSILLQHNADCRVKNKRNQRAVDLSHSCDIRRLLLNIQTKQMDEKLDDCSKTATLLLKAIEHNDLPLTSFYMSNANVDLNEALLVAAKFGRTEIMRMLVEEGAAINTTTRDLQQTVLHIACIMRRANVVKELLLFGTGCEINHQDCKGNTALHYACMKNDYRIVEMLINHGADTALKNADGKVVLEIATSASLFNITKLLAGRIPHEYSVL